METLEAMFCTTPQKNTNHDIAVGWFWIHRLSKNSKMNNTINIKTHKNSKK